MGTDTTDQDEFTAVLAARREHLTAAFEAAGVSPVPYGRRVTCRTCRAETGTGCSTRAGRALTMVHMSRLADSRDAQRNRMSKLLLLNDDLEFGLVAGDVLIGCPYPYDAKWTIERREADGYEPECNQYSDDVAWIDWV